MKKIYSKNTLLISLFSLQITWSASAQMLVPNGDFESWTSKNSLSHPNSVYEDPDNWTTRNMYYSPPANVSKSTDHHGGKYSIKISPIVVGNSIVANIVTQSFPISDKPLYFNGYYKSSYASKADYGQVGVTIYGANNAFLATTEQPFHDNESEFTPFSLKLYNLYASTPVSATITLNLSTDSLKSTFWVDDLTLSNAPLITGMEDELMDYSAPSLYPVPCTETLFLHAMPTSATSFRIRNANGWEVASGAAAQLQQGISIKEFRSGMYLVELLDAQQKSLYRSKALLGN